MQVAPVLRLSESVSIFCKDLLLSKRCTSAEIWDAMPNHLNMGYSWEICCPYL